MPGASPTSRPRGHRVKATPGAAQPHKTALSSRLWLMREESANLGERPPTTEVGLLNE